MRFHFSLDHAAFWVFYCQGRENRNLPLFRLSPLIHVTQGVLVTGGSVVPGGPMQ